MGEGNIREDEGKRIRCDKVRDQKWKYLEARLVGLQLDKRRKEKRGNGKGIAAKLGSACIE